MKLTKANLRPHPELTPLCHSPRHRSMSPPPYSCPIVCHLFGFKILVETTVKSEYNELRCTWGQKCPIVEGLEGVGQNGAQRTTSPALKVRSVFRAVWAHAPLGKFWKIMLKNLYPGLFWKVFFHWLLIINFWNSVLLLLKYLVGVLYFY